jgi:hypothetical protein
MRETLLQTIHGMTGVIMTDLPMTSMEAICAENNTNINDTKMLAFVMHNMYTNGLINPMLPIDDTVIEKFIEEHQINFSSKVSDSRKAREQIYYAEVARSLV